MTIPTKETSKYVTVILNGVLQSLNAVIPMNHEITRPKLTEGSLNLQFGVLIGITGDVKGNLILAGEIPVFALIGQSMYGMPLEGEMLESFSGELGNMIAGGLATNIVEHEIKIDITHPTIVQGNTRMSGYDKAIYISVQFEGSGEMEMYLLLD
ncbi:chemotaxis protein CheX [Virgibacillus ainsalahensis]